jgi:hypothetical protein
MEFTLDKVYSSMNLDAYKISGIAGQTQAEAIVKSLSPVMWQLDGAGTAAFIIVDGHAWDAAAINKICELLDDGTEGGATVDVVGPCTMIEDWTGPAAA